MKRGGRLRVDPAKARAWQQRSRARLERTPLAQQSATRRAERAERAAVVEAAHRRDGGKCVAAELVPEVRCWGPLDGDEVVLRSGRRRGHLDVDNVQTLCRGPHEWKHTHPAEAVERGLRRWSWQ